MMVIWVSVTRPHCIRANCAYDFAATVDGARRTIVRSVKSTEVKGLAALPQREVFRFPIRLLGRRVLFAASDCSKHFAFVVDALRWKVDYFETVLGTWFASRQDCRLRCYRRLCLTTPHKRDCHNNASQKPALDYHPSISTRTCQGQWQKATGVGRFRRRLSRERGMG